MNNFFVRIFVRMSSYLGCWLCAVLICVISGPAFAALSDNGDGTVTDTVTSLVWDKCTMGLTNNACTGGVAIPMTWPAALTKAVAANSSNYKGHTDWRLPNYKELASLVDITASAPAISGAFPNTPSENFWSSTSFASVPTSAWFVDFGTGDTFSYNTTSAYYVRLVRGGQPSADFDLATVPVLSAVAVSGITANASTLYATLDKSGTGYWLVLPQSATPPTAAQVKAGVAYPGGTPAAAGSGAMVAGAPTNFTVAGLSPSTPYVAYLVGEDATPLLSNLGGPVEFRTLADVWTPSAPTPIPTLGQWGLLLLSGALGAFGWAGLRRRGA